jgi:hypothetical protein
MRNFGPWLGRWMLDMRIYVRKFGIYRPALLLHGTVRSGRSDQKAPTFVYVYGGTLRNFDCASTWWNVRALRPRICPELSRGRAYMAFSIRTVPLGSRAGRDGTLSDPSRPPAATVGGTRGGTGVGGFMPDFRCLVAPTGYGNTV